MAETAVTTRPDYSIINDVIAKGDLGKLTDQQRSVYYVKVCESLGLNPLTRPLEYITLNTRLTLYVRRDGTDQLRAINHVNVTISSRERMEDVYVVTARAVLPDGRTDESIGVVTIGAMKGDALANALMKAETKAKRRVTLSIVGLGWLDESEIETIPTAQVVAVTDTGEIVDAPAPKTPTRKRQADPPSDEPPAKAEATAESEPDWTKVRDWLMAGWDIPADLASAQVRIWEAAGLSRQETQDKGRVLGADYKLNPDAVKAAIALAVSKLDE